ncbi:uncharacterized protein LOC119706442 isoform X2 [Motacilla alba alba]|uniref:uncharacterized protein LOC119706442 isoform X2 n=1 Tax=Motacilla alba alba TaxID=1094192 RepID=UPI0018D56728|nr:uncharacterized protein LOC119706442 isoform X2 [Motacilla alba alba]
MYIKSCILEILQSAACVTRAAHELMEDHSLLPWVLHSLEKRFLENKQGAAAAQVEPCQQRPAAARGPAGPSSEVAKRRIAQS